MAHPAGSLLARAGGEPLRDLHVIRKGAVRLEREGQAIQVLEEGETFGYTSLITGEASLDVVVEHDLVAYRIPATASSSSSPTPASPGTSRWGSPNVSGPASTRPRRPPSRPT